MSQPSKNPSQQPISFKTVPGRNRTQKWTQAKTNNYDGDDWGGYDDYDDYGGYQEPSSSQQQPGPQLQRQSSFDRGVDTERRQFSSGTAIYEPERHTSPSGSGKEIVQDGRSPDETRRRMREFSNPGAVPQPLNTPRSPETPRSVDRPPRKSSLVSGSPAPDVRATPAATSPLSDKPSPFVRPSDIYKRMAEEQQKERQSMESGRPSMDTINRETGSPSTAHHTFQRKKSQDSLPSSSGRRPSLDPVSEAMEPKPKSPERSLPAVAESSAPNTFIAHPSTQPAIAAQQDSLRPSDSSPRLPLVSRVSGFGSFMPRDEEEERISATGLAASTAAANAAASALSSGSRDVTPTMPAHQSQALYNQPTHSSDPAADIAAERQTAAPVEQLGRSANEDPSGLSHQPLPGFRSVNDPAAEIAAERRTGAPVEQLGRSANEDPSGLSHQPSSGFRSVVHKAFDRQGDSSIPASPTSRDNTQSGVSRSDTNSTGSISPIMSRVPSVAPADQRHQERDTVVSPIAEETPLDIARSRAAQDSTALPTSPRPNIMRKPTPSHSRNVSSEIVGFTPGYRRSMETPSPNNSPARTPGLGDTDSRRLSGPMSAVTVHDPEAPDVDPSAPEMPSATLAPIDTDLETPGSVYPGASSPEVVKPLPTTGRGRSGTDYSVRESDLAHETNTSPDDSPSVAEAATIHQNLFLDNHPSNPSSPTALSPTTGIARPFPLPAGSGSGRNSPAGTNRSRVRNIVDQFQQIDENSKRNSTASGMSSKSSWSNFGGDEDNIPGLNRRGTGGSALSHQPPGENATFPSYDQNGRDISAARSATSPSRPAAERLESFKPHLPGEWISAAPTPASEVPEPISLNTERGRDHSTRDITPTPNIQPLASTGEEVDLTPTTRKTKLHGRDSSADIDHSQSALSAVKNAGDALGTAFMSSVGFGHQTQDFANKGNAAPVDIPQMRPHRQTGNIEHLNLPILRRGDSDAPSDGTNSVANSVPPTPPAKDTPQPRGLAANSGAAVGRPVSNYFAGVIPDAPAPLSFGKHSPNNSRDFASTRPTVLPTLSTDTRATDFESDRLRKDIVRSLGSEKMAELKRESILEDVDRTQDALDAPENEKRVASGHSALPAAEAKSPDARSGLPSQARPGLLDQRFSWENRAPDSNDRLYSHMAVVGETKGDENRESYERPRSNQGLHVVNTQVTADSEPSTADTDKQVEPHFMLNEPGDAEKRLSSSLPIGTAALALGSQDNTLSDTVVSPFPESPENSYGGLDNLAPSPMVEDIDEAARPAESRSPDGPGQEDSPTLPSAPTGAAQAPSAASNKIPAFRDLAAIKNTDDRIAAYETTRHRFADMNTGLSGWLSGMLTAHPEYANAGSQKYQGPAVIQTAGLSNTISGLGGTIRGASHKHSPSMLKIGGERKASTTSTTAPMPTTGSNGGNADVDKIQAKGKDFMKSAGAGAKGLFAKGKSRFGRGGEKGSSSISSPLVIAPAFASVDSSSSKNIPASSSLPASATTEKTVQPPSRPMTPTGIQSVSNDVMSADRAPAPASETAERPRSVLGRLRDVSRSNTRSKSRSRPGSVVFGTGYGEKSPGPSRSVSRAASMVFGRGGEAEPAPPMPAHMSVSVPVLEPLDPIITSPVPALSSPGVMPGPLDRRREMWEDDGAEVGDAVWRDEHGRLGVLPSPSVQEDVGFAEGRKGSWVGEPVEGTLEERRDEDGEENWTVPPAVHGVATQGVADTPVPLATEHAFVNAKQQDRGLVQPTALQGVAGPSMPLAAKLASIDSKQQDKSVTPPESTVPDGTNNAMHTAPDSEARRSSLDNMKIRRPSVKHGQSRSASYATTAPAETRPQPERKFSALDQLPSQQRRRQFTPAATPRRMSMSDETAPALEPMPTFGSLAGENDCLADVKSTQTKTSRPATPANWDQFSAVSAPKAADDTASRRSSVSSLGNPQSPDTIIIPGAASKRQSIIGMPTTSNIDSALDDGQQRNVSPLPFQRVTTNSSVPTMDPDTMLGAGQPEDDGFMNRSYQSSQQSQQRPMSYMPHSRGSSSVMMQDAIDVNRPNKRYSTPSGMSDYSAPGTSPYQQQQQRPAQPLSRAPSVVYLPNEYDKLRSPQAGDADPIVGESSSRQSSGFFRGGPDVSAGALSSIPSPSKLDENYSGLVDPQVEELADEIGKAEPPQPQKRRKSGIMDSFRRTSTYSGSANANASRPSSRGSFSKVAAASNANASDSALAKAKTLKKPQRAPSAAVAPAVEPPKDKRFSRLGSLFRRSSTMTPRSSAPVVTQAGGQASIAQTSSQMAPKASKKLTKTQPPQHQQQQQQQPQYSQRPASQYIGPPPNNYVAYEAMMRQHAPPGQGQPLPPQHWQQQQQPPVYAEPAMMSSPYQPQAAAAANPQRNSGYYQQGPPQTQHQPYSPQGQDQQYQASVPSSRTHSLVGSPANEQGAPTEFYGSPQGQASMPGQPMPQPRRLHSEGHWRRDTVPGIPEANSPVDASMSTSVAPERPRTGRQVGPASPQGSPQRPRTGGQVGPASPQGSPQRAHPIPPRPTMETRQSSTYSQTSVIRSPATAPAPDNFPQAPGRQDYQTQYWQHQHRSQREPTLPQLQTHLPPSNQQTTSVGSIDQQMARSPALDYQDQQTPYAITLPQERSNRQSSASSWAQQSPERHPQPQYRGPPAAARGAVRSQSPPEKDQYSSMTPYHFVPPHQMQDMAPQAQQRTSHYGEQVSSPTDYTPTSPQQQQMSIPQTYTSASPRGYENGMPEQHHYGYAQPQQQRSQPSQNRYYGQGAPRSAGPQRQYSHNEEARPLSYQRTPSGYSGRRDDAAVSEAELMNMRGTSYPGQEWAPGKI